MLNATWPTTNALRRRMTFGPASRIGFERGDHFGLRLRERRRQAREHGGDQRKTERERERARVERERHANRQRKRRQQRHQERGHHARNRQARGTAEEKQQHRLDEHLPNQPASSRADRETHGDLLAPRARAGQQHAGHVRARDREHESDQSHQHREKRRNRRAVAGNRRRRDDAQAFAAVLRRETPARARGRCSPAPHWPDER